MAVRMLAYPRERKGQPMPARLTCNSDELATKPARGACPVAKKPTARESAEMIGPERGGGEPLASI